jgi:hypothetical protein
VPESITDRVARRAITGCALLAFLAFVGCGGGSSTGTTGASGAGGAGGSAPLSQGEFVSQMNSICKETNDKIAAVKAPASSQLSDLATTIQQEVPINNAALSQASALTPPPDLQAKFDAFLKTAKAQLALATQYLDAAKANDVAQANAIVAKARKLGPQQDAQAKSMGLTECAKHVSPQG